MAPTIGFIGLGIMGAGMARNYLKKGFPLVVWNRSPGPTGAIVEEGARRAESPAELAAASDFVLTCLADPPAVRAVSGGILDGARPGTPWIETSTIGPVLVGELAAAAAEKGIPFLESPVTGSKKGAAAGTLVAMTGGPPDLHELCAPIIGAWATKIVHCGPTGAGSTVKLVGNTLISFMLEGLCEGATLAAASGVSIEKILEVVQASGFASPYWPFKGLPMSRRDWETHFSIDLLHKDQALMLAEGATHHVPLPGLAAIHQVTSSARALGHGGKDIAALVLAVEAAAGKTG
jgi:3-hydroxyisobutyrate dehydrogenase-like beta-hydroxyacid dehydrogenase